jgi:hypothetical protein
MSLISTRSISLDSTFNTLLLYFKMSSITLQYIIMSKQNILKGRRQILLPSNFGSILTQEEWTNRNQEFSQWSNRKRRGPIKKFRRCLSNKCYFFPTYFHLQFRGAIGNSKISRGSSLSLELQYSTIQYCPYILILSLDPAPLRSRFHYYA